MTTVKQARGPQPDQRRLGLAEVIETVTDGPLPVRFTAYDGSAAGPRTPSWDCTCWRRVAPATW